MPEKQWLVAMLRRLGYEQAADDAENELPASVSTEELERFGDRHGISRGEITDKMGGSP
jgi:hypothetical protein